MLGIGNKLQKVSFQISEAIWPFVKEKHITALKHYKNKYIGKGCFILGNGPSLLTSDLDVLSSEHIVTFACNKIYKIYDKTIWRPDFLSLSDDGLSKDKKHLRQTKGACKQMFFSRNQFLWRLKGMREGKCLLSTEYKRELLKAPRFSMDLEEVIYDIATVTYFNMQLAVYMGFKKIFLLGCDNTYHLESKEDGTIVCNDQADSYFFSDTKQKKQVIAPIYEANLAYKYAEQFSRDKEFKIYNATRGGKLEAFERISFEEAIKMVRELSEKGSVKVGEICRRL